MSDSAYQDLLDEIQQDMRLLRQLNRKHQQIPGYGVGSSNEELMKLLDEIAELEINIELKKLALDHVSLGTAAQVLGKEISRGLKNAADVLARASRGRD